MPLLLPHSQPEDVPFSLAIERAASNMLAVAMDSTDKAEVPKNSFVASKALDAASTLLQSIDEEYNRLALQDGCNFTHRFDETIPVLDRTGTALQAGERLTQTYNSEQTTADDETLGRRALKFACGQIATDLLLSREIFGQQKPAQPDPDEVDETMLNYEQQADLPAIEYGFFKPTRLGDKSPYEQPAARALLSEWKLGANPALRPPFENPYDEAKMQERAANKQFEAYRSRIAGGMDMSASQPMPNARMEPSKHKPKHRVRQTRQEEQAQSQPQAQSFSQSQSQSETRGPAPMFTQVLAGAHGGRPAKKKRLGGF